VGTARATRAGARDGTTFRRTIGLGEVTVMPGSWVAAGDAASCAIAWPPIPHSNSQPALLTWKARFTNTAIVPIPEHPPNSSFVNEFENACRRYPTGRFRLILRTSPWLAIPQG
jgi:hypothetical protein